MNNADVAKLLGLDVLLVVNGGLGSTYDVLNLNKTLCNAKGVSVCAVVINKVCAPADDDHLMEHSRSRAHRRRSSIDSALYNTDVPRATWAYKRPRSSWFDSL